MKDERLNATLSRLIIGGAALAAAIMLAGLIWYYAGGNPVPSDHLFTGEPRYLENPLSMARHAVDSDNVSARRSLTMIGVLLLLITPIVRVAFAGWAFAQQRDRLYAGVSLFLFVVLLISSFW